MEIQPNHNPLINGPKRLARTKKGAKGVTASSENSAESVEFNLFDELVDKLSQMPEKREEFLQHARELLKDPNYPNAEQLEELEEALALHQQSKI
jgi:hypothetical protein